MRHLVSIGDLSRDEIEQILALGLRLKQEVKSGQRRPIFQNLVIGLLFEKPSLRTRVSFESLMNQHGGSSLYLGADVGWPSREPICDFMPILTSYLDALVIRAKNHQNVIEATKYSRCPIINGLTDASHPCQALADIMTIREHAAGRQQIKLAYVGDANNVAVSLAEICSKLQIEFSIAAPAGFQFSHEFLQGLGFSPSIQSTDPREAVRGADFVYTDVWTSMGQEAEMERRRLAFANFQVTPAVMAAASPDAKFLHCLPARRGEEVAAAVISGPHSIVIEQAENRLHAQKGLMAWLLETSIG